MYLNFLYEDEVLQEEGLDCSKDATRSTFLLEYSIGHFLIEEEALAP